MSRFLALVVTAGALLAGCTSSRPVDPAPPRPAAATDPAVGEARGRGTLTVAGDEGGFPPLPLAVQGATEARDAIRALLDAQVAAWNAGDIRGFMTGYEQSDSLTFVSDGQLRRGWQAALYAYMRTYPDAAAMGTLTFEDIDIDVLAPDVALVQGLFRLRIAAGNGREASEPLGLFSLVLRRDPTRGWVIIHDHTSSSP